MNLPETAYSLIKTYAKRETSRHIAEEGAAFYSKGLEDGAAYFAQELLASLPPEQPTEESING